VPDLRDDELRDAFGALHRTVQASAPTFAALASPEGRQASRRRRRRHRASLIVAAVVVPSVIIVFARSTTKYDFERFSTLTGLDPGAVSWKSPSDFLLSLPGSELLEAVPSIDVPVPVIRDDSSRAPDVRTTLRRSSDS
jgi:hypothetical protein